MGILVGWGSTDTNDVTTGYSDVIGGTIAAGPAISTSLVAPLNSQGNMLHVDPVYGVVPVTWYIGLGAGGVYAGGGGGRSVNVFP
jgi:hypothetical protein